MNNGFLTQEEAKNIGAVLTDRTVLDTFYLKIPIYKLEYFEYDVHIMQYDSRFIGEDLRPKNLWFIHAKKDLMNVTFVVSDLFIKQRYFLSYCEDKIKSEFKKLISS